MILTIPYPHSVTVHTRVEGPPDTYNMPTETETSATVQANVQPAGTDEDIINRDSIRDEHIAYFPPSAALSGLSAVTYKGTKFEVVGAPRVWDFLNGQTVYQSVLLRKIRG